MVATELSAMCVHSYFLGGPPVTPSKEEGDCKDGDLPASDVWRIL